MSWFGKKSPSPRQSRGTGKRGQPETIDDLIILERYEEAEQQLKFRLKDHPKDLHAHLKLAEVFVAQARNDEAVDEFVFVAEEWARDGFIAKGKALLAKARKLRPMDESLALKESAFEQAKRLEHSRVVAVEGLRGGGDRHSTGSTLVVQRLWPKLAHSPLVQRLDQTQIKKLFSVLEPLEADAGEVLEAEGSDRQHLLWVVKGIVSALAGKIGGEPAVVRTFSSGDVIGEVALFERRPWPATYRADEKMIALVLDRKGLEESLTGNTNPKAFLDALRSQANDRAVAHAVAKLRET